MILAVNLGPPFSPGRGKTRKVLWRACHEMYRLSSLREIARSRGQGATVLQVTSAEIESHGLFAFEGLDMIEEEGYKATQYVLPALHQALGYLDGRGPSTTELDGGTGG